jgi:hypothetical protein
VAGVAAVESARSTNPAAFCLGSDLAPLFVGYALFTAEQAIERGLEQLLFMTREGEFFVETFDLLFAHGEANGHVLPQWKVLAVSRMSTFAASLAEISFAEMMRLWSCFSIQTMTAFGSSLGVDIPMEWLARHALDGDEPLSKPWRDRRVSSLFGDPDFVSLVQERAHAARRGFLSYAARELSDGRRPIGLVDIGWRGTIQDNIASILPDREFHGIYLALEEFLNPQPPNTHKIAYGPDRNRGDDASLLEPFLLLEMLCNSPNGSVTGYETMRNGVIRAVRVVSEKENRTFLDFTQHLQEGVYCAARVWKPYVERYAITSGDLRKAALHIWRGLVETPPADVINAHVTLDHNAMFWTGGFTRAVVPSYRTLLFAPLSKKHRLDLVIFFVHSQNLTYVSMRNDLDFIEKLVWGSVVGAIRALRGLKRRLAVVRRTTIRN